MRFVDRVQRLAALRQEAWQLGLEICQLQRTFGDFHLKTALAVSTSDLVTLCDVLERKLTILDFGFARDGAGAPAALPEQPRSSAQSLERIRRQFEVIRGLTRELLDGLDPYVDLRLQADLEAFLGLSTRDSDALHEWVALGPTDDAELQHQLGLARDCALVEADLRARERVGRRITDAELRDPFIRACYLSANAYLELTSLDIVSDLIVRAAREPRSEHRKLVSDLNRQLLDEARHAELLAARVERLGFELGGTAVSLHTWNVYEAFDGIAERLVVQQVLGEGVGLDSSAHNIIRLVDAGDLETADIYAQITADEKTHVELGVRWASQLACRPIADLIAEIAERADVIDPLPRVPVALELRRQCGFPAAWLDQQAADKGALPADQLRDALLATA